MPYQLDNTRLANKRTLQNVHDSAVHEATTPASSSKASFITTAGVHETFPIFNEDGTVENRHNFYVPLDSLADEEAVIPRGLPSINYGN